MNVEVVRLLTSIYDANELFKRTTFRNNKIVEQE